MVRARNRNLDAGGLAVSGGPVLAVLARGSAIDPVQMDLLVFPGIVVQRGHQPPAIRDCAPCHTSGDGAPYGGDYSFGIPCNVAYGTNVALDRATSICTRSEAAFIRAMRGGVNREGQHVHPAFPCHFLVRASDEDLRALYAGIRRLEPSPNASEFRVAREIVSLKSGICDNRPAFYGNGNSMPIGPIAARYSGDMSVMNAERPGAYAGTHYLGTDGASRITSVDFRRPNGGDRGLMEDHVVLPAQGVEPLKPMMSRSEAAREVIGRTDQVGRYPIGLPGTGMTFLRGRWDYAGSDPQEMISVVNLRDGPFGSEIGATKLQLGNPPDLNAKVGELMDNGLRSAQPDRIVRDRVARRVPVNCFHEQVALPDSCIIHRSSQSDTPGLPRPQVTFQQPSAPQRLVYARSRCRTAKLPGGTASGANVDFTGNNHITGMTIMGNEPATSVVDAGCRTHRQPDAAGSLGNSPLTLAAVSLRPADHPVRLAGRG